MEKLIKRFKEEIQEKNSIEWVDEVMEVYSAHSSYYAVTYGDDCLKILNDIAKKYKSKLKRRNKNEDDNK